MHSWECQTPALAAACSIDRRRATNHNSPQHCCTPTSCSHGCIAISSRHQLKPRVLHTHSHPMLGAPSQQHACCYGTFSTQLCVEGECIFLTHAQNPAASRQLHTPKVVLCHALYNIGLAQRPCHLMLHQSLVHAAPIVQAAAFASGCQQQQSAGLQQLLHCYAMLPSSCLPGLNPCG